MPLFRRHVKKVPNPAGPAIPDFTNVEKMREYVSSIYGDELKAFRSKLGFMRKACHNRWCKVDDDQKYMKWYEWHKAQDNFDLEYCIVKWDPGYPAHVSFHRGIHNRYDRFKSEYEKYEPGSGFYEYEEKLKYLLNWINNITDTKLLMEIQKCCIVGLTPA